MLNLHQNAGFHVAYEQHVCRLGTSSTQGCWYKLLRSACSNRVVTNKVCEIHSLLTIAILVLLCKDVVSTVKIVISDQPKYKAEYRSTRQSLTNKENASLNSETCSSDSVSA